MAIIITVIPREMLAVAMAIIDPVPTKEDFDFGALSAVVELTALFSLLPLDRIRRRAI